jgi:hypothetical protein
MTILLGFAGKHRLAAMIVVSLDLAQKSRELIHIKLLGAESD